MERQSAESAGGGGESPAPAPAPRRWRWIVNGGLWLIVVAFVGWTAWDLGRRWHQSPPVDFRPGWLAVSLVPMGVISLTQAVGWRSLLMHMTGRRLPAVPTLELLLASMLGRYAPAKIGMPAILMSRAKDLAIPGPALASSLVLMAGVYAVLGVGMGVASLGLSGGAMPRAVQGLLESVGLIALVGMVAALGLMLVVDRSRYPNAVLKRLALDGRGPLVNLGFVAWFALVWICWWLHGVCVLVAVGATWSAATALAGMFVLAPAIGFLAVVAPGGLGVREAVIANGVAHAVGSAPALAASLWARVASLGLDVAMWLLFYALQRARRE